MICREKHGHVPYVHLATDISPYWSTPFLPQAGLEHNHSWIGDFSGAVWTHKRIACPARSIYQISRPRSDHIQYIPILSHCFLCGIWEWWEEICRPFKRCRSGEAWHDFIGSLLSLLCFFFSCVWGGVVYFNSAPLELLLLYLCHNVYIYMYTYVPKFPHFWRKKSSFSSQDALLSQPQLQLDAAQTWHPRRCQRWWTRGLPRYGEKARFTEET